MMVAYLLKLFLTEIFLSKKKRNSKSDNIDRGRQYMIDYHRHTTNFMEGPPLDRPEVPLVLNEQAPDPLTIMDQAIYRTYQERDIFKGFLLTVFRFLMNRDVIFGMAKFVVALYCFLIAYTGIAGSFNGYMAFKIKSLKDFYEMVCK